LEQLYSPVPSFTLFAYSALVSFFGFTFPPPLTQKKERKKERKEPLYLTLGHIYKSLKRYKKDSCTYMKGGKVQRSNAKWNNGVHKQRKVWCRGYGAKMWHNRFWTHCKDVGIMVWFIKNLKCKTTITKPNMVENNVFFFLFSFFVNFVMQPNWGNLTYQGLSKNTKNFPSFL